MKREDIAKRIAEDLLNDNVLDEQNFNYDTDAILQHVQDTVSCTGQYIVNQRKGAQMPLFRFIEIIKIKEGFIWHQ